VLVSKTEGGLLRRNWTGREIGRVEKGWGGAVASCIGIGGVWPLALVDGETSDLVSSEGGFVEWAGRPSVEQGRDCGE